MATNSKIKDKQKNAKAKQFCKDIKSMNFSNRYKEMKTRQGWSYRPPGQ